MQFSFFFIKVFFFFTFSIQKKSCFVLSDLLLQWMEKEEKFIMTKRNKYPWQKVLVNVIGNYLYNNPRELKQNMMKNVIEICCNLAQVTSCLKRRTPQMVDKITRAGHWNQPHTHWRKKWENVNIKHFCFAIRVQINDFVVG